MAQSGFEVDTGAVRQHARNLGKVTDRLGTAREAAGQVSLNGTDAYGVLCSPVLTPLIGMFETAALTTIGTATAAVEATAAGVRGAAETYDEVDRQAGELLESVRDELGEI